MKMFDVIFVLYFQALRSKCTAKENDVILFRAFNFRSSFIFGKSSRKEVGASVKIENDVQSPWKNLYEFDLFSSSR